ncbi:hypothetical protein EIP91_008103 [Steccherinum ochraceum]|uniref:Uncharacterized protein n=1 Tax=Steccherinum ochraceum TaxID=92696 RepID=A0A4R0R3B6_9APHY|nr:hypothetical protein EIP91_008103 [Steccherinum ochraceum]
MVEAIRRIRASGKWRVIALTNNFSKTDTTIVGDMPLSRIREKYPDFIDAESEFKFLGWNEGATPPNLRAMFDDFVDSSAYGMRKPDPEFYMFACKKNGITPQQAVFLDDLGMNLKAAEQLGMETIRKSSEVRASRREYLMSDVDEFDYTAIVEVRIGGSLEAISQLEKKLGIDLTTGFNPTEYTPSKL